MMRDRLLKIAQRMHLGVLRELGRGVEAQRVVDDPLYARDVLLVCDAFVDNELALLSAQFRRVAAEASADGSFRAAQAPQPGAATPPAFGADGASRRSRCTANWFTG